MIGPPNFYSTPTEDELFHHYKTIGNAIGLPIMLYNNPATANVDLTPQIVARLSAIENCRYINESTLEVTRVRDTLRFCRDQITVFGGIRGFESLLAGASDWVAVASNVAPGPPARLFHLTMAGQIDEARTLYLEYLSLIEFVGG